MYIGMGLLFMRLIFIIYIALLTTHVWHFISSLMTYLSYLLLTWEQRIPINPSQIVMLATN